MSWAAQVSSSVRPAIVAHHDLDGIARSAIALLSEQFRSAEVHIVYSRKHPATNPIALAHYLKLIPSSVNPVLFIDIAIDVKNPQLYINALAEFSKVHQVIWTEHHETDLTYLYRLAQVLSMSGTHSVALWAGPSAYDYSIALAMWLGLDPNDTNVRELAILTAIGDRDPKILTILNRDQLMYYYELGNGLDVIIREISSQSDPASYDALARTLAINRDTVFSEARQKADQIPTITNYDFQRPVVIAQELLHQGWGPKSLERLALRVDVPYAIGVSLDPRTNRYIVRAITLWTKLNQYTPIGLLLSKKLHDMGYTFYGPPAAIVIRCDTNTFDEALNIAYELANTISSEMYVPKTVTLINERNVAQALQSDFNTILSKLTEILETQKKMYQEYLTLKKRQVELLEQATDSSAHRYD
ncbi:hypothetical protein DRO54_07320 [Candidatus Bathyarchaeota archaeon]|nr:MAG: hypothetical protein DRO54_07320 [Candidatus Bathyarchaeota archaeon]